MATHQESTQLSLTFTPFVFILVAFLATSAQAFERVTLGADLEQHQLGDRFSYLEDRHGEWTITDIHSGDFTGHWRQSQTKIPNFGLSDSVYWFAVDLENRNMAPIERFLAIAYPMLDSVDVFLDRGGLITERYHVGDKQPFNKRIIEHRHFLIPIHMTGHETATVYLRVQTNGSVQVPATLWSERAFWKADQFSLIAQGLYFGIMLAMILYNLFIYTSVRDRSYVYYVLFVCFFTLTQLMLHGFAFQLFWPKLPWINEKIWVISMNVALMFTALFATSFLELKQQSWFFYRAISWVALIAGTNALASLVISYRTTIDILAGISLPACFLYFAAGCMMWHRGYTPARYYTIAWAALLVGTAFFILSKLGFVARTLLTENAMQIGSTIEVILLAFALANRINVARREKELAQTEAVSILQKYRTLYENAIEGIFQTKLDYAFSNANRAMTRILGINSKQALLSPTPMNLRQCFSTTTAADEFCNQLEEQHEIIGHEFQGKSVNGRAFWASLSVRTYYDDEGQPLHYEGSLVDITERRQAEEQVRVMAYYDHVTGLPNRALLHEHIKHALVRAKRNNVPVAVLFVDLDRFKMVNDTLGHNAGDQLLQEFAARLTDSLRGDDWVARPQALPAQQSNQLGMDAVARLGGDEFVMVLSDIRQVEDAAIVAQRITDVLSQPFMLEGKEVYLSASIGISTYPIDGDNSENLLKNADAAMYHAKKLGKNRYQFYAKYINEHASKRLSLETKLRRALSQEQFQLYYQPKVNLDSGLISGIEALCRWPHSEQPPIPPNVFIPLAEESGLIIRLSEWVLRAACEQNKAWQNAGLPPTRISVNLSSRQFQEPNLVQTISQILQQSGLDSAYLELEITETTLMDDTEVTGKLLAELKAMGLYISIDDFGTGYSSLSYLKRFPVDVLKIDRSFIHDIGNDADNRAITAAIISMAQQLSLKVITEGVETQEQLNYLRACGCNEIQGYLASRPLPSDEFSKILQRDKLLHPG
jgi:PAS domain S-box-containing protein